MELKVETCSVISKRQKSHGKGKHGVSTGSVGVDRIGRLPDAMLCHILSFFETRYAVRASVLSKRWRYVWTSVPCIEFRYPDRRRGFIDFLDRVLQLNTVSWLRKLNLSWTIDYERLEEWISIVMERDIGEIVLDVVGKQSVKLPTSIFTLKNLSILKLSSKILLDVPPLVYLPSLKILSLYADKFLYEDWMTKLLDGCPVLEELNVKIVEAVNVQTFFIRSSLLKRLSIYSQNFNGLSDLQIVVDVPNVERLELRDYGNVQYDIYNVTSLVKFNIDVRQVSGLVQLLEKFSCTEFMVLSFETMESLESQPLDNFPMFHNLTHLEVKNLEFSPTILPTLLECSPNLVTFVSYSIGKGRSRKQLLSHFKAPKCMMCYLEEIQLRGVKGFMDEMEMISYFLKSSLVLKKLSIQSVYSGAKTHSEISKKLLTFPRSSPECQIIFD